MFSFEAQQGALTARGVLATISMCGQTIRTSGQWKCADLSTLAGVGDDWKKWDFAAESEWINAEELGPNGITGPGSFSAGWNLIENQAAYWIWGDESWDGIACRFKRYARPQEFAQFEKTNWRIPSTNSERECASWRCSFTDPVVSIVSQFPRGSQLHLHV